MSVKAERTSLARLVRLRELGLRHAVNALAAAREHAVEMQRVRDEQLALIDSIQAEVRALDAQRDRVEGRTAEALKLAAVHRRWLVFDLEKEQFYLETMEDDVMLADEAVAARLSDWRRLRARLDAFAVLGAAQARDTARHDERRSVAELDDRPARIDTRRTDTRRTARAVTVRIGS